MNLHPVGALPLEEEATQECVVQFLTEREQVIIDALTLYDERAEEYDLGAPIWHKLAFGDFSFASEIINIAKRMGALLRADGDVEDKVDDSLIDLINYSIAMLTVRRLRKAQTAQIDAEVQEMIKPEPEPEPDIPEEVVPRALRPLRRPLKRP